ncbi:RHS repeat-associated core domain-containing protein [Bryobacter aggregatus]|uniref:RHS repeat-associated core domain-containing protein n=1 Tax=Bryobacter aggregatus TaxID=360054 RepID=UPI0004E0C461|nr:RHS repeat-associated core domain-containing protein [Bryobacter aggregatus]
MAAVIQAAKATAQLFVLAAVCLPVFANIPRSSLVAEKPHLGVANFALVSHRADSAANVLIAPGLPGCLYDSSARPCCSGKERDAETGLDFFSARYMSAAQGRFTSPDVPFADQWEKNPQSWNLYSYARNNPLRFVDPTGRCSQAAGGYTDEGSGLFPGPCSGGTIGDSNNNTNSVTVTGKKGNAVGAFVLNALFALDSTANNYFAWMFKERPKLLENTPTTKEFVGQAAAATVLVGTMMIGPSGGAQAPLRLIHSEATLSKTILDGLRKKSTQEIIDTLKPGLEEGLKVKPDGRVMDGNHRIKVLMERGVDVNSLPREVLK